MALWDPLNLAAATHAPPMPSPRPRTASIILGGRWGPLRWGPSATTSVVTEAPPPRWRVWPWGTSGRRDLMAEKGTRRNSSRKGTGHCGMAPRIPTSDGGARHWRRHVRSRIGICNAPARVKPIRVVAATHHPPVSASGDGADTPFFRHRHHPHRLSTLTSAFGLARNSIHAGSAHNRFPNRRRLREPPPANARRRTAVATVKAPTYPGNGATWWLRAAFLLVPPTRPCAEVTCPADPTAVELRRSSRATRVLAVGVGSPAPRQATVTRRLGGPRPRHPGAVRHQPPTW